MFSAIFPDTYHYHEGAHLSRLTGLASSGRYDELEGLWLDSLSGGLDPDEAAAVFGILTSAGEGARADDLLEVALGEMDGTPGAFAILERSAQVFGVSEVLRPHLVEMMRDRHLMLGPLERFLADSGLLKPGCNISDAWRKLSELLRFDAGNWVLHTVHGPGRILRITRTQATVDFGSNRAMEMPLDGLFESCSPIAPDGVAVLRRIDPAAFSALCAEPAVLLARLLDENEGTVEKSSLGPVLGPQAGELWKALRDAAKSAEGLLESPDRIERLQGGGLENALREAIGSRQPLAERVARVNALLKAALPEEQREATRALLAGMPELRSVEAGARFELIWTLLQAAGEDEAGRLARLVDPLTSRALQALTEISAPRCRRDFLSHWTRIVDPPALEYMTRQLAPGQRQALLDAAAATHPGWAVAFLRGLVFGGTDSDLLLWASSVLLDGMVEDPGEKTAIIRTALDVIPRGRAENQRRASRTMVERAGDELRALLKSLDARKLSNLSDILGECGPAHEAGLCLEIRRESSGRTADSGRTYYFWESEFVFDGPAAIRRRAEAMEKLRTVEIPAAAATVGEAASHGDLSENAEYKAALERRDLLLERMSRWSEEFGRLRPFPAGDLSASVSSPGTGIRLSGDDGIIEFLLVGPLEARPEEGRVNYLAPLGSALLGRRQGELLELPGRTGAFTVDSVRILGEGDLP